MSSFPKHETATGALCSFIQDFSICCDRLSTLRNFIPHDLHSIRTASGDFSVDGFSVDGFTVDGFTVDGFVVGIFTVTGFTVDGFTVGVFTVGVFTVVGFTVDGFTVVGFTVVGFTVGGSTTPAVDNDFAEDFTSAKLASQGRTRARCRSRSLFDSKHLLHF